VKKELPLAIGLIVGLFAVLEFYIPDHYVGDIREFLITTTLILSAGAYILGAINILQVNVPRVRRREEDWQYKVVLIVGAAIMGLAGIQWHTFGGAPNTELQIVSRTSGAPSGTAQVLVQTGDDDALVDIGAQLKQPAAHAALTVPPGKQSVRVYMKAIGYTEIDGDLDLADGEIVTVRGTPTMMWGPDGRVYTWIYEHVFAPCNATMFALLAFFVASAAFRAFRARNAEAALLLVSAIIILIGRAPMGRSIHPYLPEIADWMLTIPNNAGRRAIMMGAAIAAVATGLRVILGLERSHLGAD
jgi:hypothetical protein